MKPRKYRLRIRLHRKIYDLLEMEALWQDSKIGTLANRILREELAKLRQVGLDHCVCGDEDADPRGASRQRSTPRAVARRRLTAAKSICRPMAAALTRRDRSRCWSQRSSCS